MPKEHTYKANINWMGNTDAGTSAYSPVSALCINKTLRGGLLLGYTAFDEKQIKQGVKKLVRVLQEFV